MVKRERIAALDTVGSDQFSEAQAGHLVDTALTDRLRHIVEQRLRVLQPEVAVPRELFGRLLDRIARLRPPAVLRC